MLRASLFAPLPIAVALILAGCGGGNKNNTANAPTQAPTTQAAAVAAAAGSAPATTVPAATVVTGTTATGVASATRTGNAPAGASTVAATTTDPCASVVPSGQPGTPDSGLQASLAKVALTETDLPSGYQGLPGITSASAASAGIIYANQTASYTNIFTKPGPTNVAAAAPPASDTIVEGLEGFTTSSAAGAVIQDLQKQVARSGCASGKVTVEPVAGAAQIGDESRTDKETITVNGQNQTVYSVFWRRGKVDVILAQFGTTDVTSPNDVLALAKKLDDRMKAGGF
jgi:hypothetical protein